MGWLMFFVGLVLPPLVGWWLITRRRANVALTLLGAASIPMLVWAGSLGAKIGPCKVGDCMSSGQHSRLVIALVALALLVAGFVLLAMGRALLAGAAVLAAQLVGAFSMTRTDSAAIVLLLVLAAGTLGYLVYAFAALRETARVPDYPPPA